MLIVLVVLVILLLGGLPQFGLHSYGYTPVSVLGVVLLVLLVLVLLGRV
jgi:hypothetical protein